jgi:hypothetical protein
MRWAQNVACMKDLYILIAKGEEKGLPGRLRHRWKDIIKMGIN